MKRWIGCLILLFGFGVFTEAEASADNESRKEFVKHYTKQQRGFALFSATHRRVVENQKKNYKRMFQRANGSKKRRSPKQQARDRKKMHKEMKRYYRGNAFTP